MGDLIFLLKGAYRHLLLQLLASERNLASYYWLYLSAITSFWVDNVNCPLSGWSFICSIFNVHPYPRLTFVHLFLLLPCTGQRDYEGHKAVGPCQAPPHYIHHHPQPPAYVSRGCWLFRVGTIIFNKSDQKTCTNYPEAYLTKIKIVSRLCDWKMCI